MSFGSEIENNLGSNQWIENGIKPSEKRFADCQGNHWKCNFRQPRATGLVFYREKNGGSSKSVCLFNTSVSQSGVEKNN